METLGDWWLPREYFEDTDKSGPYGMTSVSHWARSGVLHHSLSGTVFAGDYGIKWAVLLLFSAYWTMRELDEGRTPPYQLPSYKVPRRERTLLTSLIHYIYEELHLTVHRLHAMREEAAQLEHPMDEDPPVVTRADLIHPHFEAVS